MSGLRFRPLWKKSTSQMKRMKLLIGEIYGKFSISPGIQGILLNSRQRLKGKLALSPRVIKILQFMPLTNWDNYQ